MVTLSDRLSRPPLTVGSLFTGIGGFDLAFENAGAQLAWQVENNKDCRAVLDYWWPAVPCHDDVETVNELPRVDVLCGGFPCQDLSVAGRRAGLAGDRSRLFFEFMRIAEELAPTWVLIENVPGLLSSGKGRDMGTVLGHLADLGYGWAYRVLDAQNFGVAQRRRRVFIVGCAGGRVDRAGQVLFEPESCDRDPAPRRETGPRVTAGSTSGAAAGSGGDPPVAALTSNGVGTCGADDNQAQAGHLLPVDLRNGTIGGQGYQAVRAGMQVRRLTPTECERLQGFPDDWTAGRSDSARYRMLGNAVCVPVVEWIAKRMVAL